MEAASFLHTVTRTSAVENVWVDKARAIDLIRIFLPAHDRALHLHPFNLESILSIK